MKPQEVVYPRNRIKGEIKILYDDKVFSVSSLIWDNESRIGIRWNGNRTIGYPVSRSKPTWFILPKQVALSFAEKIGNAEMYKIVMASSDKPL